MTYSALVMSNANSNTRELDEEEKQRCEEFCAILKELGWSQSEAGRQLAVSSNHINMIEKGNAVPSEALLMLARMKRDYIKKKGKDVSQIEDLLANVRPELRDDAVEAVKSMLSAWSRPRPRDAKPVQPVRNVGK